MFLGISQKFLRVVDTKMGITSGFESKQRNSISFEVLKFLPCKHFTFLSGPGKRIQ